jgi:hypothetical protein
MKMFIVLLFSAAFAMFNDQEMVNHINGLKTSWTAGLNEGSSVHGANHDQVKAMLGARKGGPKLPRKTIFEIDPQAVPDSFDSATNWPQCTSMKTIRDQSACGSCWAFGAVEAMTDRNCIFLNQNISLSAAGLAFCCTHVVMVVTEVILVLLGNIGSTLELLKKAAGHILSQVVITMFLTPKTHVHQMNIQAPHVLAHAFQAGLDHPGTLISTTELLLMLFLVKMILKPKSSKTGQWKLLLPFMKISCPTDLVFTITNLEVN